MDSHSHAVSYLSPSAPVSMGDWWFDIAKSEHFWIRRRFDVMVRLADSVLRHSTATAEIGCGNGLLQREIEDKYGKPVTGFDLNELALQKNISRKSPVCCYDIHQRNPELRGRFDLLLLCDVLEHIENESEFLQSVKFHLAPSGFLLINVPAHQSLYSDYDRAAGHVRRYSLRQLAKVAGQNHLKLDAATYWGLPLLPLLLLRKTLKLDQTNGKAGFDSRGPLLDALLYLMARCEPVPHGGMGTSVMAVFQNQS